MKSSKSPIIDKYGLCLNEYKSNKNNAEVYFKRSIGASPEMEVSKAIANILKKNVKKVLTIETDKTFLPILEELKEKHPKKFEFILNDVLKVDLDKLISENYSVISNLPYNISVPFIISLLIKGVSAYKTRIG